MLANKVVMVTGVGSGLGRALAIAFIREGALVVGVARRGETLHETEALVASGRFSGYVADVTKFEEIEHVVDRIVKEHGRIDVLFNNAAVYPKMSFLEERPADWSHAIDVNLNGVANCCKAVLPGMIKSRRGRIYNVGSFADISPIENSAAYSATKGAVRALTKAIAMDLRHVDADIEIHEWIPGHLSTQMSGYTGMDPATAAGWAVHIASMPHARTRNCIFENDREWLPPKRLVHRLMDELMVWRK